jgi:hypothetical protein
VKLPSAESAQVPKAKIVNYLLSPTHRAGRSKAAFFRQFGFSVEKWDELAAALRDHCLENPVVHTEETVFGTRHVVDGLLKAPDGTELNVRSAWFIDKGRNEPRFISAHPLKRRKP